MLRALSYEQNRQLLYTPLNLKLERSLILYMYIYKQDTKETLFLINSRLDGSRPKLIWLKTKHRSSPKTRISFIYFKKIKYKYCNVQITIIKIYQTTFSWASNIKTYMVTQGFNILCFTISSQYFNLIDTCYTCHLSFQNKR